MGNLKALTDSNEYEVTSNETWEHGRIYFLKSDQDEGDTLSVTVTFNDKEKYSDTNGVVDLNLPKVTETAGEFLYTFPSDLIESFGGATPTPIPEQHWMQMDSAELKWSDADSGYVILKNVTIKNPDWLVGYNGNPEYHIVRKSYFTSGGNIKDLRNNWDSFVMFGYSSTLLGYSNNAIDSSTNLGVNAHYIDSDKFTNNADYALSFYGTQQDTTYNTFTSCLGTASTELVLAICGVNYDDSNTTGEILIDLNVTAPSDPTPTPIPQPDSGSNDGSDSSFDVSWARIVIYKCIKQHIQCQAHQSQNLWVDLIIRVLMIMMEYTSMYTKILVVVGYC